MRALSHGAIATFKKSSEDIRSFFFLNMICNTKNTVVLVILVTSDNSFLEIGTPSRLIRWAIIYSTRMDGTSQAILAGELAWTPMGNMP